MSQLRKSSLTHYSWVLAPVVYENVADLLGRLKEEVINPANDLASQQIQNRLVPGTVRPRHERNGVARRPSGDGQIGR